MRVAVSASVVCLPGLCPRHLFNIEHYSSGMLIGCKEACDGFGVSDGALAQLLSTAASRTLRGARR
jgi:hypothetical protein